MKTETEELQAHSLCSVPTQTLSQEWGALQNPSRTLGTGVTQPSSFLNGKNLHTPECGVWKQKVLPVLKAESLVGTRGRGAGDTTPFQLSRPWLTALVGLPGGAENTFSEAWRKKKLEALPFGKAFVFPVLPHECLFWDAWAYEGEGQ